MMCRGVQRKTVCLEYPHSPIGNIILLFAYITPLHRLRRGLDEVYKILNGIKWWGVQTLHKTESIEGAQTREIN